MANPSTTAPAASTTPSTGVPPGPPPGAPPPLPQGGFGWLLLQMVLVLIAICALAYVVLRWGLRRFQEGVAPGPGSGMRVVHRMGLEPRRSLYVVEVGRRFFLVGTSETGLTLLSELDAETAAEIERRKPPPGPRRSFREILFRKKS